MAFRDIKRRARRALHDTLKVPALYFRDDEDGNILDTPTLVHVRVHTKWEKAGDMAGTNLSYAEVQEINPRIIFMVDQVAAPARNAIVSIAVGEAYRLDNVLPPDDITVTAEATRMPVSQTIGLPVPPDSGDTPPPTPCPPPPAAVTSVNGKTGAVVLTAADVGAATEEQGLRGGLVPAITFEYGDATPAVVFEFPWRAEIVSVSLQVEEAFDGAGAEVSLGTPGDDQAIVPAVSDLLAQVMTADFTPRLEVPKGETIVLTIVPGAGATRGRGQFAIYAVPID